jgi:hypothetical protein
MQEAKMKLEIITFILSELRKIEGEVTISRTIDFDFDIPNFDDQTCISSYLDKLNDVRKKNDKLIAFISKKEGEYEAYQNILKIIE